MTNRLGRYELLSALGQGGMAEVWRARVRGAAGFQTEVALKVIRTEMATDEAHISMFVDEACLSAHLKHPNIVATLDFGRVNERYFIALELIEGVPLRAAARHCLPELLGRNESLYIVAEVAAALDYAYSAPGADGVPLRLVHRDVNPTNVLVTTHGHVKLNDFGIAKATGSSTLTTAGALKGKLAYMAPEQAWGRAVDGRTDVYALGLTLHELLVGKRAIPGSTELEVLDAARRGEVADVAGRVPTDIEPVLQRMLARDPAERYQTAGEVRAALLDLLGDASVLDIQRKLGELSTSARAEEARAAAATPRLVPLRASVDITIDPVTENATRSERFTPKPPPAIARRSAWWLAAAIFPISIGVGWWVRVARTSQPPAIVAPVAAPVIAPVAIRPVAPPPVVPTEVAPVALPVVAAPHPVDKRPGVVRINADPWAEIWIDGKSVGMTPLAPIELAAGRHDIRAKHPQLGERHQSIAVSGGSSRLVKFSFAR